MTADVSKATAKVKSEIPGREKEAEKTAEKWSAEAKAKADGLVSDISYLHRRPMLSHCMPHAISLMGFSMIRIYAMEAHLLIFDIAADRQSSN